MTAATRSSNAADTIRCAKNDPTDGVYAICTWEPRLLSYTFSERRGCEGPSDQMPDRQGQPDLQAFARLLAPAVRQAAAIARALEGRVANQPKPGEMTAVKQALTVADTAAQEALLVPLLESFPDVCVEAEEDTETVGRFPTTGDSLVVIDPVDGTLHSYLGKQGPYAVILGLAVRNRIELGMVALPREGLFFEAIRRRGARAARAGGDLRQARIQADGDRVLYSHGMPNDVVDALRDEGFDPRPACGGAVAVAPLITGVRAGVRYAAGANGISVRGRIGVLIAREAGASVRAARGADFPGDLTTPAPVLAVAAVNDDLERLDRALAAGGLF